MFRKILIPLDGSVLAEQALRQLPHVVCDQAHIYLVQVIAPPAPEIEPEAMPQLTLSESLEAHRNEAMAYLKSEARQLELLGFKATPEVLIGEHPANEIVTFAAEKGVDLIIMTTHGRSGLSRLLFGSVAESVVRQAPCPVLIVRPASETGG
jgi:nucleotide-binding universal stress UspA family protein